MSSVTREIDVATYLPVPGEQRELLSFVEAMEARGRSVVPQPVVVDAAGHRHVLSPSEADMIVRMLGALARGQAVTVIPRQRLLTTQEAADILNVSRPTLVKILERGELGFEMRGRHRRIHLEDLLEYQEALREKRAQALDEMQRDSQRAGDYDATDAAPIIRR